MNTFDESKSEGDGEKNRKIDDFSEKNKCMFKFSINDILNGTKMTATKTALSSSSSTTTTATKTSTTSTSEILTNHMNHLTYPVGFPWISPWLSTTYYPRFDPMRNGSSSDHLCEKQAFPTSLLHLSSALNQSQQNRHGAQNLTVKDRGKSPMKHDIGVDVDADEEDEEEDDEDDEEDEMDCVRKIAADSESGHVTTTDAFAFRRKKKTRTVFSRAQVFQLESTFDLKRYLSSAERSALAGSLHLTETQFPSSFCWSKSGSKIDGTSGNDKWPPISRRPTSSKLIGAIFLLVNWVTFLRDLKFTLAIPKLQSPPNVRLFLRRFSVLLLAWFVNFTKL